MIVNQKKKEHALKTIKIEKNLLMDSESLPIQEVGSEINDHNTDKHISWGENTEMENTNTLKERKNDIFSKLKHTHPPSQQPPSLPLNPSGDMEISLLYNYLAKRFDHLEKLILETNASK